MIITQIISPNASYNQINGESNLSTINGWQLITPTQRGAGALVYISIKKDKPNWYMWVIAGVVGEE